MKSIKYVLLSFVIALFTAGSIAPLAFAEVTTDLVVNNQNLTNGVAVMDNGTICAATGGSIEGFDAEGHSAFSISLPAKPGNLCAYGDYLFAAGYTIDHMNEIYVLKPGDWATCKTLNAGLGQIAAGGVARSGVAAASTVVMMIVPIIVFVIMQSNVIETMGSSGMKD